MRSRSIKTVTYRCPRLALVSSSLNASYLLKCGCCDEKLEIYYDEEGLEINGVNGSIEDWREILLPLLRIEKKGTELVAK